MKLLSQVRDEVERFDPDAIPRLTRHDGHRPPARGRAVIDEYQRLTLEYPNLGPTRDPAREPGDPWIITYASIFGYTLVTSEVPRSRLKRRKREPQIPDVCDSEDIPWMDLRELAEKEGWLL